MLVAAGLGLLIILVGPVVVVLAERLFAPTPDVAVEFERYLAIRLFGAPAALASMVVLGWFLGLQDSRRPLLLMIAHQRHQRGPGHPAGVRLRAGDAGCRQCHRAGRICRARDSVCGCCARTGGARAAGRAGACSWLPDRFRRLLAVNRDLFLRSLMLEAAFVSFAAIGSRQGEVVLAANAVLMNFFTAAAYGLDGFAHAAEAMVGRTRRRARPAGLPRGGAGELRQRGAARPDHDPGLRRGGRLGRAADDRAAPRSARRPWRSCPTSSPCRWSRSGPSCSTASISAPRARPSCATAWWWRWPCSGSPVLALVPPLGNHGLWLALLLFLAARALVLAVIYRRIERRAPFVPVALTA